MSSSAASTRSAAPHQPRLTPGLVLLFAFCCGAIVSNLYYAQPLIELMAPDVGISVKVGSMIVSLTQIGYAVGMLFLVPLGDLLENRRLMVTTLLVSIASLIGVALAQGGSSLLAFSILVGLSSVSVQIMVPIAASMADDANRGRVVGNVMSGLLVGILLSRPVASLIADHFGWRAVFGFGAIVGAVVVAMLWSIMPRRQPPTQSSYGALLASVVALVRTRPVLRQRSYYQACMFAGMVLFWTAVPIELSRRYGFNQTHIALFSIVGAAGILTAPIAGRLADAGYARMTSAGGMLLGTIAFLLPFLVDMSDLRTGVITLGITAVLLDGAVQLCMVSGQREIYALDANSRSRINSVYMTAIFLGGAGGSALASPLFEHGGWSMVAAAGALMTLLPLAKLLVDTRGQIGRQGH